MSTIKVCCVDSGEDYPYTLVFHEHADYNANVGAWDMHSGHGAASIEWVIEQKNAPNDVAKSLLDAYAFMYAGWGDHTPNEYELVSVDEFVNQYWEA